MEDEGKIGQDSSLHRLITSAATIIALVFLFENLPFQEPNSRFDLSLNVYMTPLAMHGGDPYIRALMRTISASEANDARPYSVLYGGQHINNFDRHPGRCMRISFGPNIGNCSTAAGRYQLLHRTWQEKVQRYYPQSTRLMWHKYSFQPEFQDAVVYAWLNDPQAWGMNISQELRQGNLDQVQRRLSSTWTSLGYGIEDNSITGHLPDIYQEMLHQELKAK